MKLKLTLVRPGAAGTDILVTAEPTSTIGDLARELSNSDPLRRGEPATAGSVTLRVHPDQRAPEAKNRLLDHRTTLADSRLAGGAEVSIAPASEAGNVSRSAAAAVMKVVAGPESGREIPLASGSSSVGRAPDQRVVIADPLVSKSHLRINITDIAEVIDLGSANGTMVNGEQVDRAVLATGDTVMIGDSSFTITVHSQGASAEIAGIEYLNRSPRLDPQYSGRKFLSPEPPERNKAPRLPIIALIAPVVMGVALFAITRSATSILFVALSPILLAATYIDNRVQIRRQWKTSSADFVSTVNSIATEIDAEHERERAGRIAEAPSLADVAADVDGRGSLLWTRRPEHDAFGLVRLGLGTLPSRVEFDLPEQRKGVPEHWELLVGLSARAALVGPVPVAENLRVSGSIGVAGQSAAATGAARAVVAQLVGLHSPAELVIAGFASSTSAPGWDWLKWLPHTGSVFSPLSGAALASGGQGAALLVSELEEVVSRRSATGDSAEESATLPLVVVVVEDDAPVERARLVMLAESGPAVGVHFLWVAPSVARIPAACRTFLEVDAAAGVASAGYVHTATAVQPVECESLDVASAERYARSLAPVIDAGVRVDDASDLPRSVSLLQLVGTDLAQDPDAIIARWTETNSILTGPHASVSGDKNRTHNLRAVFGQATTEPFAVDLRADGPHALVGGTTGSGKSEFLQAWVLALAAAHSPERITFLFVDYKGGAAFAECIKLPHYVGIVTDLSEHMVRRALTSLLAELRYREELFNTKGHKDIIEFERSGDTEVPPSLVIVVDEFAALATEVPEFVAGVVDVAQRGRSLGLHLILATQRPAGVINDNLRANTPLRIALRMADASDSENVLDSPIAATFDPAIPGRGAVKAGPGRVRAFQSGYAGGRTTEIQEPATITVQELGFGSQAAWEPWLDPAVELQKLRTKATKKDIVRIVETVGGAATRSKLRKPRRPWQDVLADTYEFRDLENHRTDSALVLGFLDDPATQSQRTVSYLPDTDGNMAIIGAGGSGKSAALRGIAIASAVTIHGGPVHVYGIDFASRGLDLLKPLPHVGTIIDGDDEERLARLLRWLRDLVDRRLVTYKAVPVNNIGEYRQKAKQPDEPRIILLLDGMSAFRDAYETSSVSPWFSVFSQIATDGRSVGVHVVVTGDRAHSIPPSLSSSIQRRIVLRMATKDDYATVGVEDDVLGPASPPGRGIIDDREVQLAVLGGDPNLEIQAREIEALAASMTKAGIAHAPGIEKLSDQIALDSLPVADDGRPVTGIADDTLAPIGIEPVGGFSIIGPPGSGRTTALFTIASALARAKPTTERYHFTSRRSALSGLPLWKASVTEQDKQSALIEKLTKSIESGKLAPGAMAIFVENLGDYYESPLEREMDALVAAAMRAEQFFVGESETSTWKIPHLLRQLRTSRRGLILQPEDVDGDLLSTSLGRLERIVFPPGRGYLVGSGRARRMQVAQAE